MKRIITIVLLITMMIAETIVYKLYQEKNIFYITGVPLINQYPNYPRGCETVALTILLNYYGIMVTPDDIISVLPKTTCRSS